MKTRTQFLAGAIALATVAVMTPEARAQARQHYDLPEQDLGAALKTFAAVSGREVVASSDVVARKRSAVIRGDYAPEQAITLLLARTGLRVEVVDGAFVVRPLDDTAAADGTPPGDIIITGSRIRGAKVASPVVTITREGARDSGQATLGEIVRAIPQSFGGGQNPAVGLNVPSSSGVNVGGGSSINLRGLGSDATLTLLNGRRLSYSGSRQSIDVSTIPLGAVDRLEIVADGASAIYGSDAVGGVANIVLRRDITGVETLARLGWATEGGDFDQQYGVTAGARWSGGGFIAAYEFNRTTAIDSAQRDYAATRSPGLRLLPSARSNNALFSAHQSLATNLEFSIDALYNDRRSLLIYSYDDNGDLSLDKVETRFRDRAFAIAPSLSLDLGAVRISLSGSYAKDRVDYGVVDIEPGYRATLTAGCYCNRAQSLELSGDGRMFRLPGGDAKLALGAGYRKTYLNNDRGAGYPLNFAGSQSDVYGYGELSLPIFGTDSGVSGIYRLNISAAVRYEHYDGIGSVATPKLGIIWAPIDTFDLKASWGKSFRAPTLLQRYQPNSVSLSRATSLGGTGYPVGSTALFLQGGGAALRPERATSWTVTAALHPPRLKGFDLEISYFSTRYIDRIVAPIVYSSQSLSDPVYVNLVTRLPSLAQVNSTIANAALFSNFTGLVFNPANVVAIVDDRTLNAGSQPIHGFDILFDYRAALGSGDSLTVGGNASYLVSRRQITAGLPYTQLAGTVFNPPHWRGRGSLGWQHGGLAVTAVVNYAGSLRDPSVTPATRLPSQATFDLAVRYRLPADAPALLRGLDVTIAAQNLFDRKPPLVQTTYPTETPYDSTNYSPVGRFISIAVSKRW